MAYILHVYQLCQNCVGLIQYKLSRMPPIFRAPIYRKPIQKTIHTFKNPHPQKKMNWLSTPPRLILWL